MLLQFVPRARIVVRRYILLLLFVFLYMKDDCWGSLYDILIWLIVWNICVKWQWLWPNCRCHNAVSKCVTFSNENYHRMLLTTNNIAIATFIVGSLTLFTENIKITPVFVGIVIINLKILRSVKLSFCRL